jgi:hypothetical protein
MIDVRDDGYVAKLGSGHWKGGLRPGGPRILPYRDSL